MSKSTAADLPDAARPLARLLQNPRHGARALFGWLLDDVLADLAGRPPDRPPPAEARPLVRDLAGTYARAVAGAPFEDVLGPLFLETICRGDQRYRGQFFTPWPVARLMAELAGPGAAEAGPRPGGGLWRLCEPACGSGVLPLAFLHTLTERHGPGAARRWSLTAVDLDGDCARMAAAQLLANGLIHGALPGELLVYRGNSLGPAADLTPLVHLVAPDGPPETVAPALHPARVEAIRAAATSAGLDLFGLPLPGAGEAARDRARGGDAVTP